MRFWVMSLLAFPCSTAHERSHLHTDLVLCHTYTLTECAGVLYYTRLSPRPTACLVVMDLLVLQRVARLRASAALLHALRLEELTRSSAPCAPFAPLLAPRLNLSAVLLRMPRLWRARMLFEDHSKPLAFRYCIANLADRVKLFEQSRSASASAIAVRASGTLIYIMRMLLTRARACAPSVLREPPCAALHRARARCACYC